MSNELLGKQISEMFENVLYTYSAHWNIVNRLDRRYSAIKIIQIVLTAITAGGFIYTLLSGISWLSWIGGVTSAASLPLNLYLLNFNVIEEKKKHEDAANALWDVREKCRSLLVDFSALADEEIRKRRDLIINCISEINKKYPGTEARSFARAKNDINKYMFEDIEKKN